MSPTCVKPVVAFQEFGQTEVADLGDAVFGQQDIGRFQIAVHDPVLVGMMDGAGQGFDQAGRVVQGA